jgi:hypothetical protein
MVKFAISNIVGILFKRWSISISQRCYRNVLILAV